MHVLRCDDRQRIAVPRYVLPRLAKYVKKDPADGVARGVWEEESTKKVPEPHLSEPVDLSLLSLWVQVIKALRDPGR